MDNRQIWIDVLKGIAIISVVIGHNMDDNAFVYCFHMPLFFILSGFIFSTQIKRAYLQSSVRRLLIPYISFLIIISVPEIVSLFIHSQSFGDFYMRGGVSH